jgi:hypothetical protein
MNHFLLPGNEPNVHVRLLTTRQDLLPQQWDVDFSDCACSPSLDGPTDKELEFTNRIFELDLLKNPRSNKKVIDAPAGYGKTKMLCKLATVFQEVGWKWAFVDLKNKDKSQVRQKIAVDFGVENNFSEEDPDRILRKVLLQKSRKILFLFDSEEEASSEVRKWLLEDLVPFFERADAIEAFLVIFAGRYVQARHNDGRWKGYDIISLSEFSQKVVKDLLEHTIRKYDPSSLNINYDEWSQRIVRLSGGHPRSIKGLILYEFLGEWEKPTKTREVELFDKYVKDEIQAITASLDNGLQQSLERILVFRKLAPPVIDYLKNQKEFELHKSLCSQSSLTILTELTRHGIVAAQNDSPFYADKIVRKILNSRLRLLDPEKYQELNKLAAAYYDGWIQRIISGEYSPELYSPEKLIRMFWKEALLHFWQQYIDSMPLNQLISLCLQRYSTSLDHVLLGGVHPYTNRHDHLKATIEMDEDIQISIEKVGELDVFFKTISPAGTGGDQPELPKVIKNIRIATQNKVPNDLSGNSPKSAGESENSKWLEQRKKLESSLVSTLLTIQAIVDEPNILLAYVPKATALNRSRKNSRKDIESIISQLWDRNKTFNEQHPIWTVIDNALPYAGGEEADQGKELIGLKEQIKLLFEEITDDQ